MTKRIVLASPSQVAIYRDELRGQLSDGMWENARPFNHWEKICDAEVTWSKNPEDWGRLWLQAEPSLQLHRPRVCQHSQRSYDHVRRDCSFLTRSPRGYSP